MHTYACLGSRDTRVSDESEHETCTWALLAIYVDLLHTSLAVTTEYMLGFY